MLSEEPYFQQSRDVTVFSRASLQLTFDLLRSKTPQLALDVRNLTGSDPLPRAPEDGDDKNGDNFRVSLDLNKVRAVVQGLMEFTQPDAVDIKNPEINIMARALMQDWLILAHHLMSSQPLNPDLKEDQDQEPPKPM
ncbi:MAG: hypothetical protein GKR91_15325 [Pseudomonadales bacterium]|nr:hypothetical protein [Pseudomonadales bacterium]